MKKFLNFIASKIFRIPRVNLDNCYPLKVETPSLDVETLAYECSVKKDILIPEIVYKKKIGAELVAKLIPYIRFETTEDIYTNSIRYRGVIRIVKER